MEDGYRHKGLRKKLVSELARKAITDARVLAALEQVPRHLFIDDTAFLEMAYVDAAFPIGCGQTISQPWTVAMQSQLLAVSPGMRVLEIGTGSGYQTAVLAAMGAKVFSIERHKPLYLATKDRLKRMGVKAFLYHGDGFQGLPREAPFDRILVTCGAPYLPEALRGQLKVGGIMVVPVGAGAEQTMLRLERRGPKDLVQTEHGRFRFVPMLEHREG